jgi:hypothetical protein
MAVNNALRQQEITTWTGNNTNELTCQDGCGVVGLEFNAPGLNAGTLTVQRKIGAGYATLFKTDGAAYSITVAANAQAVEIPANDLKSLTVFRLVSSVAQAVAGRVIYKPL